MFVIALEKVSSIRLRSPTKELPVMISPSKCSGRPQHFSMATMGSGAKRQRDSQHQVCTSIPRYQVIAEQGTGKRVRMSVNRLRTLLLPDPEHCSLIRVVVDNQLAGHAFSCRWKHQAMNICWVTQLVVHSSYRQRGLAVGLLRNMRKAQDDVFGIASSHPAACMAASKACNSQYVCHYTDTSTDVGSGSA